MTPADSQAIEGYFDTDEREAKPVRGETLRKLFAALFRHRPVFAAGAALILVSTAATLLEPRVFGFAIDEAIVPRRLDKLRELAIVFLLIECVRVSASIGHSYLFSVLGQRVMQDLRVRLFSHFQALPVAAFDRSPVGRLITRVTNDIGAMEEMFTAGFIVMMGNALVVLGILAWLLALDFRLGLISASAFPILAFASYRFSLSLQRAYREARAKLSALNAFLAENILGMRVVHLFNRQATHLSRFRHINESYAQAQFGSVRVYAYFQPSITWAAGASMALVIWKGGVLVSQGALKIGILVTYFSYVLTLFQPMREIADKWNIFLSGLAAAERVFATLEWKTEGNPYLLAMPASSLRPRGEIRFENVWFAYTGDQWVLRDFSLELRPGMKLGVVGHTGAGKTTLISLLLRFYEPQRGRITLDGVDIRELDKRALRSAMGLIQQDVFLFSGTIDDNVRLGRELEPDREEAIDRALRELGYADGAGGLELQERGSNLSAGQRQLLAFARALAADPSIWILDEATANVDSGSEERVGKLLASACQGKTTILIAHRLATVRECDRIIVLHQGALVESGSHAELMAGNGLYARLFRYQAALGQGE